MDFVKNMTIQYRIFEIIQYIVKCIIYKTHSINYTLPILFKLTQKPVIAV
jgi:hypothetical protein